MIKKNEYRILLLTSYCGGDDEDCTDEKPCFECLKMCNSATIPKSTKLQNVRGDLIVERAHHMATL